MYKKLFDFKGRIARLPYFGYSFAGLALYLVVLVVFGGMTAIDVPAVRMASIAIIVVAALATLWFGLSLAVKRLHDLGHSGLLLLALAAVQFILVLIGGGAESAITTIIASVIGIGFGLYLLLMPGSKDTNNFGPVPVAAAAASGAVAYSTPDWSRGSSSDYSSDSSSDGDSGGGGGD